MPATTPHVPRPYLAADARRAHLLDVAAGLVRRGGWSSLSMQGLAAAAGVSRQLVYERFGSADELGLATLTHLFERAYARAESIARGGKGLEATIRAALAHVLDLPAEERHALRALAAGSEPGRPALARVRARLRARIASIWVPYLEQQSGVHGAEAAALAWMLVTSSFALADAVEERTLERRRALDLFVRFVTAALAPPRRRSRR